MFTGIIWDSRDESSALGPESQWCCCFEIYQVRAELLKAITEHPEAQFFKLAYIEDSRGNLVETVFERK